MINKGVGTRQYYETYYSSRDWKIYKSILSTIVLYSEPGPVLDVGAGTGFIVEGGSRWGLDCKGIEGSIDAIRIARERYPAIDIVQGLLSEPFPFPDASFQTIVMNEVIEHLETKVATACLGEVYRGLSPGGMLFVASPSRFNKNEKEADPTHINLYSPKELKRLLYSKGFEDIIPLNTPLSLLGTSYLGKGLMYVLFKLTKLDHLSATATCIAYKPIA